MQAVAQKIAELIEFPDSLMYAVAGASQSIFGSSVTAFGQILNSVLPDQMQALNNYVAANQHPLSKKLPLMHPEGVIFAAVLYLVFIVALYPIGQAIGKLTLKNFALLHNAFLFALSLYMGLGIMITAVASFWGNPNSSPLGIWNHKIGTDANGWRLAKLIWVFYVSKLPEFIDTVIMMLKHNYRQVSFLHLYHHSTIFVIWFFCTMEGPGGDAYWSAQVNSLVHVFMYFYYLMTSFAGKTGPLRSFLESIKFFITKGQMIQFAFNALQSSYLLWVAQSNNYPRHLIQLLFYYMLTLLALFGNFLIQNQGKKGGKKGEDGEAADADGEAPRKSGSVTEAATASAEAESAKPKKGRSKKE